MRRSRTAASIRSARAWAGRRAGGGADRWSRLSGSSATVSAVAPATFTNSRRSVMDVPHKEGEKKLDRGTAHRNDRLPAWPPTRLSVRLFHNGSNRTSVDMPSPSLHVGTFPKEDVMRFRTMFAAFALSLAPLALAAQT